MPLVSVVTPVYNGEAYLIECIESVLLQTYENWEYIIINNCSDDNTLNIAESYAKKDDRIHIYTNDKLLPIMENWNSALQKISSDSKYCKVVHADDWLFPECLDKMVEVAEKHPSVGLVGSYGLWNSKVVCDGLPYPTEFIEGRELCKMTLLGRINLFWSPSSLLIRSDIIRGRVNYYNEPDIHADVQACYEVLESNDFGFVHQVLTYIRKHEQSVTSVAATPLNLYVYTNFDLLKNYGPRYLTNDEYQARVKNRLNNYYIFLSRSVFEFRDADFWKYHKNNLKNLGFSLSYLKLVAKAAVEALTNPRRVFRAIIESMHIKRLS